jgi:hypothetical protein
MSSTPLYLAIIVLVIILAILIYVLYKRNKNKKISEEESLMSDELGFKFKTDSTVVKRLIGHINKINRTMINGACTQKTDIKSGIGVGVNYMMLSRSIMGRNCDELMEELKKSLDREKGRIAGEKFEDEIIIFIDSIYDMAKLIIPTEVCLKNEPNALMIQKFLFDIVDAVCDGSVPEDDSLFGIKIGTESTILKKLIYKTNSINRILLASKICTKKEKMRSLIKNIIGRNSRIFSKNISKQIKCDEIITTTRKKLLSMKEELMKSLKRTRKYKRHTMTNEEALEYYVIISENIIDIAELILSESCVDNNLSKKNLENLIDDIIDAFCIPLEKNEK